MSLWKTFKSSEFVGLFRGSRRNIQDALNACETGHVGWMKSLTRKHMLDILLDKNDQEAIKVRSGSIWVWGRAGETGGLKE